MSISKNLSKNLGGKWTYDYRANWWCDDGIRYVSRTHSGAMDFNGEPLDGAPHYWLYGHGKYPIRAELYMLPPTKFRELKAKTFLSLGYGIIGMNLSKCCKAPIQVTDQEVYHPKAGCFGHLDGKGCKIRRTEKCAKCGNEFAATEYREKRYGII